MKNATVLLPAAGFVIAVGCALTPRPTMPAPFFGYDPDTKLCTQGIIEGTCTGGSTTQCTITVGGNAGLPAFDSRVGTTCSVIVYRPSPTPPPGGEDTPTPQ